ncbi:DUF429 domain-containing protein [Actinopolymorpha pittospori]|uniref:DUF429 domain-containing protein n=1 Tax=Actinopolymorpha pittospori TaxID=648752 RepID=UPI00178AC263
MLTVGVDLAAEATKTAVAMIDWSRGRASVREVRVGADDDLVLRAVMEAEKAGIDCPFGWPDTFVEFVRAHRDGDVVVPEELAGSAWRRGLAYRVTDEVVRRETGLIPLSVAADLIGHTAMRCAGILAKLARAGTPVDRSGAGIVVEVYPAATLKTWHLPYRRYKGRENLAHLSEILDALLGAAPWLDLGRHDETCRRWDDAFDAVVAALAARAASLGLVGTPTPEEAASARTEGWIAVPTCTLDALRP